MRILFRTTPTIPGVAIRPPDKPPGWNKQSIVPKPDPKKDDEWKKSNKTKKPKKDQ